MNLLMKGLVILFAVSVVSQNVNGGESNPVVSLKTGKVKGAVLKSFEGRDYHAFMSIPYAKSTSGLLRFKPPKRVDPWDGIFDATKTDSVECPQIGFLTNKPIGSEDCLVINVYVPQIPKSDKKQGDSLPVLVFIHGGGFVFGDGAWKSYRPDKFMDQDVILVTFNYRLGIFGFFSTEDSVSPGNYGMLDQVLALRWVNENIANFGGDPALVTIFGESAGAASVVYHMISPLSNGLFSNAIAQSGSALDPWALQKQPLEWAKKIADNVRCPTSYTLGMLDCFLRSSSEILLEGTQSVYEVGLFPHFIAPSIEGPGGEGFLTDDPAALIKARKVSRVPFFGGLLADEAYYFYLLMGKKFKNEGEKFLNEDLEKYLSILLAVDQDMYSMANTAKAVKKEYFGNVKQNNSEVFLDSMIKMISDCFFGAGMSKTLDMFFTADVPTLAYRYSHLSEHSVAEALGGNSGKYVSHADDLLVQFHDFHGFEMNANDTKVSKIINSLWTAIAAGKELAVTSDGKVVDWDLYDIADRNYLNLKLNPVMAKGKMCTKDDFWFDVVPKLIAESKVKDEL